MYPDRFSLEPALALTSGVFAPPAALTTFGSTGDSDGHRNRDVLDTRLMCVIGNGQQRCLGALEMDIAHRP